MNIMDMATGAAQTSSDGGFSVGTLLMFIGGAILLAFFSSIGIIARLRDRRIEERRRLATERRLADARAADARPADARPNADEAGAQADEPAGDSPAAQLNNCS